MVYGIYNELGPGAYFYSHLDISHRIHGAAIYGNMDSINIPPLC